MQTVQTKEPSLIKLIVKAVGSNKFLNAAGRWTRKAERALNYPNLLSAIHASIAAGVKEVELVLRFEDDAVDRCYSVKV